MCMFRLIDVQCGVYVHTVDVHELAREGAMAPYMESSAAVGLSGTPRFRLLGRITTGQRIHLIARRSCAAFGR